MNLVVLTIVHTSAVPSVAALVGEVSERLDWAGMTFVRIVESSDSSTADNLDFEIVVVGFVADNVVDFAANCFQLELED